jgi:hypothetical protein
VTIPVEFSHDQTGTNIEILAIVPGDRDQGLGGAADARLMK